ncbi:MAG: class I SAM-dependent methyltransferase [Candidatus Margulisbacteria bacterium]|nr:class I SAM-dependent methyltransferase [Candidatus Margulisiibacteriota bacterium]
MAELTKKNLEAFLEKLTRNKDTFALFERVGLYGTQDHLFSFLKSRLEYCMDYLGVDFPTLFQRMMEYQKKNPQKEFGQINAQLYQDEMHPVIMALFYAVSEPFMLRKIVKQEILYLAFKLQKIKKIFIAGVGCGEIFENISKIPLIKDPEQIKVIGLDISASAIDFCKKRTSLYKFKIISEIADLDFYEFSEKYDLTELSEVIEHVRDPQKLVNKAANSSKLILVTIPLMLDVPDHLHLFNVAKAREIIRNAKLDIIYETARNSFYVRQFFYFALLKGRG